MNKQQILNAFDGTAGFRDRVLIPLTNERDGLNLALIAATQLNNPIAKLNDEDLKTEHDEDTLTRAGDYDPKKFCMGS